MSTRKPRLLDVLTDNLPKYINEKTQKVNHATVAVELGITRQALHRCTNLNLISSKHVKKLTTLKGSTLTLEKLLPFIDLG